MTMRMSVNEYQKLKGGSKKNLKVHNPSRSTLCKNDTKDEVFKQAVEAIRDIQGLMPDFLFRGSIGLKVTVEGKTRADIDNIFKGVSDALQGLIYKNDKQVVKGEFSCGSE